MRELRRPRLAFCLEHAQGIGAGVAVEEHEVVILVDDGLYIAVGIFVDGIDGASAGSV